jgi:hypothetical protein
MTSRWLWGLALGIALAPAARAQDAGTEPEQQQVQQQAPATEAPNPQTAATSPAFEQACVDLLQGRVPSGGPDAIDALSRACEGLMDARTSSQREAAERAQVQQELAASGAQQGEPQAQTGTGAGAAEPGQGSEAAQGLGAAFAQAGRELRQSGGTRVIGRKSGGDPVRFSLVTNPVGWFTGLGINAEGFGSIIPKVSWVGGLRYSKTDANNGTVNTFGAEGGADYFLYGRNNEGLRIGPRLELAVGRETFQRTTTFAFLGLSGEVGYNFIATNGITGALGVGVGGRIAGDDRDDDFSSFTGGEFGPYAKLGLGFSW